MKLPTCSFSLQDPVGPRLLLMRARPPSSFVFTQPEGGCHSHGSDEENDLQICGCFQSLLQQDTVKRIGTGDNLITFDPLKINFSYDTRVKIKFATTK